MRSFIFLLSVAWPIHVSSDYYNLYWDRKIWFIGIHHTSSWRRDGLFNGNFKPTIFFYYFSAMINILKINKEVKALASPTSLTKQAFISVISIVIYYVVKTVSFKPGYVTILLQIR